MAFILRKTEEEKEDTYLLARLSTFAFNGSKASREFMSVFSRAKVEKWAQQKASSLGGCTMCLTTHALMWHPFCANPQLGGTDDDVQQGREDSGRNSILPPFFFNRVRLNVLPIPSGTKIKIKVCDCARKVRGYVITIQAGNNMKTICHNN